MLQNDCVGLFFMILQERKLNRLYAVGLYHFTSKILKKSVRARQVPCSTLVCQVLAVKILSCCCWTQLMHVFQSLTEMILQISFFCSNLNLFPHSLFNSLSFYNMLPSHDNIVCFVHRLFYTHRYTSAVYVMVILSVCLFVSLFVTQVEA